jgi:HEAT repeat protein
VIVVLGNQIDPSVVPKIDARLKELATDQDSRVQFAALNALTMQGSEESRKQLCQFYFRENLPLVYKERILQTLTAGTRPEDTQVLIAAVGDSTLQPTLRMAAVAGLSISGDPSALPALEACAGDATSPDLSAMAQDAIRAIQNRETAPGGAGR